MFTVLHYIEQRVLSDEESYYELLSQRLSDAFTIYLRAQLYQFFEDCFVFVLDQQLIRSHVTGKTVSLVFFIRVIPYHLNCLSYTFKNNIIFKSLVYYQEILFSFYILFFINGQLNRLFRRKIYTYDRPDQICSLSLPGIRLWW